MDASRILNNLRTAVLLVDRQMHITLANAAAEQLTAISTNKLHNHAIDLYLRFPDEFQLRLRSAFGSGEHYSVREVSLAIPQQRRDVLIDCAVTHSMGEPENWCLLEMTESEQQARFNREEMHNAQQAAACALLRELAHEIKNPLGGLRGAAQLLAGEINGSELSEYTGIIVSESDRLSAMIDRLLGPSQQPRFCAINIHEVLEYVRQLLDAQANNVHIERDYDPSIPPLWGERDWLVQIFLNIARNAEQALEGDGNITLKTRVRRNATLHATAHKLVVVIEIIDDGPGVPESIRDTLFYPKVSGRADGNGIGLSIAQRLAYKLGGNIEHRNEQGHTVFTVLLPFDSAPLEEGKPQ